MEPSTKIRQVKLTKYDFTQCIRMFLLVLMGFTITGCNWVKPLSMSTSQVQGNSDSYIGVASADGRYVAFHSSANNLVPNDTNGSQDVFMHDTVSGATTRVSVDSAGNQAIGGHSFAPVLSADGRYVAFSSWASNLVANDTNLERDVFLHDVITGETTRLSVDSAGNQANGRSWEPDISGDGRFVSFRSNATNLASLSLPGTHVFLHDTVTGVTTKVDKGIRSSLSDDGRFIAFHSIRGILPTDGNNEYDVYLFDRATGQRELISLATGGAGAVGEWSLDPDVSSDGRYVAFRSEATNLVPNDTNGVEDIFLRDTVAGTTTRVSVSTAGMEGNGVSTVPSISGDGRYVAFYSNASNLVPDDFNGASDVFLHDTTTGTTSRISLDKLGAESNGGSYWPTLSRDGHYVVFETDATNLFPNDTNGSRDIVVRAIPTISVSSVFPDHLPIGSTTSITILGTNFPPEAEAFVQSAQHSNMVVVDENTITMDVTIPAGTPAGTRNVGVILFGTGPGVFRGASANCSGCVTFQ